MQNHDPITGLPLCSATYEKIEQEIAAAERQNCALSLVMINIDNFDAFNRQYGYEKGNKLLLRLKNLLHGFTRNTDFIGRCPPADFVLVLPFTDLNESYTGAQRIVDMLEANPIDIDGCKVKCTASAGVSQYSKNMNAETFFKMTEKALLYAKYRGKNQVQC